MQMDIPSLVPLPIFIGLLCFDHLGGVVRVWQFRYTADSGLLRHITMALALARQSLDLYALHQPPV